MFELWAVGFRFVFCIYATSSSSSSSVLSYAHHDNDKPNTEPSDRNWKSQDILKHTNVKLSTNC